MWLVNYQDWVCLCQNIDRTPGTEFVEFHGNTAGILATCIKGLAIDNHCIYRAIGSKAVNLGKLCRVIDKVADFFAVILCKMIFSYLERFVHALPNRDAWHNDDELAPAVAFVELVHRLYIGVCFTNTGFHFDGEVIVAFEFLRRLNLSCALNGTNMVEYFFIRY